jgi:hypothetical protein
MTLDQFINMVSRKISIMTRDLDPTSMAVISIMTIVFGYILLRGSGIKGA